MDVNSLRILNDYLNQTIDAVTRGSFGLSHSPFGAASVFGVPGLEAAGLSHTPYTAWGSPGTAWGAPGYAQSFGTQWQGAAPWLGASQPFMDPLFGVPRNGLTHSPYPGGWPLSPIALEMVRQQQLTQAIVARQAVLEAACRSVGIPV
jgi:hypothetical protein